MGHGEDTVRPTYSQTLGAIGWYFDRQDYRGVFVAEVEAGYIGKARPAEETAELHAEGFSFPHEDVAALINSAAAGTAPSESTSPLCPEGYGTFLRAVGEMCDRSGASYVSVLEVTNGFVLGFTVPSKAGHTMERRRSLLDKAGIDDLMDRVGG
jgi:hypothetical protein